MSVGDSGIHADVMSLESICNDFYQVPDFQREYVWGKKHIKKLLDDASEVIPVEEIKQAQGADMPKYFLGSMVVYEEDDGVYQLVDGQQRMTTIYIMICVVLRILAEKKSQKKVNWLEELLIANTGRGSDGTDQLKRRLIVRYNDEGVLDMIADREREVMPSEKDFKSKSAKKILNAYKIIHEFFEDSTENSLEGDPDKMIMFMNNFISRTTLIRIITDTFNDALKIFETINATGEGLKATDLVKNFLFRKTDEKYHDKLDERWKELVGMLDDPSRFLRYYIMAHYEFVKGKDTYEWFVKNGQMVGIEKTPIKVMEQFIECAKAHAHFESGKDAMGNEQHSLKNIGLISKNLRQHCILLQAGKDLDGKLFDMLCKKMEDMMFCSKVIGERGQTLEPEFSKWAVVLRKVKNEEELKAFFEEHLDVFMRKMNWSIKFQAAFQSMSEDNTQRDTLKNILRRINEFIDENSGMAIGRPDHGMKQLELEHILPQSRGLKYVGKLGNLTLLEEVLNQAALDKLYAEKCEHYKESKITLTNSLAKKIKGGKNTRRDRNAKDWLLEPFEDWNSDAIDARQEMLVKLAHMTWNIPRPD